MQMKREGRKQQRRMTWLIDTMSIQKHNVDVLTIEPSPTTCEQTEPGMLQQNNTEIANQQQYYFRLEILFYSSSYQILWK